MSVNSHHDFYLLLTSLNEQEMYNFFRRIFNGYVFQFVFCSCMTLVIWEHVLHYPSEFRTWKLLYQGHILPARLAILLVRYSALVSSIFSAFFIWSGFPNCYHFIMTAYCSYAVLWGASASIFLMRLNIIFAKQREIMWFYFALWLATFAAWVFSASQMKADVLPAELRVPFMTVCYSSHYPRLGCIAWALSVMFDSTVFLGTFLRFRHSATGKKSVSQLRNQKWSFEANLFYFGTSCALNISCFVSILTVNDPTLSHLASAVAMAHHCIIATRLVFSAKGWSKRMDQDDELVLNTFNKKARARTLGIVYTIEETVAAQSKDEQQGDGLEDGQNTRRQRERRGASLQSTGAQASDSMQHARRRMKRRSAQTGAEPISPLPRLHHDRKTSESQEALVEEDGESIKEASNSPQGSHSRITIPTSPSFIQRTTPASHDRSERAMSSSAGHMFNEDGSPVSPSQLSSYYSHHPYRAADELEHGEGRLGRYKEDDEISSIHQKTKKMKAMSSCSTLMDNSVKSDSDPVPQYRQGP